MEGLGQKVLAAVELHPGHELDRLEPERRCPEQRRGRHGAPFV